jgi:hypothetical protein
MKHWNTASLDEGAKVYVLVVVVVVVVVVATKAMIATRPCGTIVGALLVLATEHRTTCPHDIYSLEGPIQ